MSEPFLPDPSDAGERALLARLLAGPVSGGALAAELGVTRAAVWKRVEALRAGGVEIDARPGVGYAAPSALAALGLLDAETIAGALPPAVRRSLARLEVAWSVDSTNSVLLRRPAPAATEVLFAERQTAGRGRRGRAWASPLGASLYLSLQRRFEAPLVRLGGLSLAVGVAVAQALHALGLAQVGLKWPNDLVVEREGVLHKLGGILIEFGGEAGGPVRAVVGIGINMRLPAVVAAAIDQPWCDVAGLAGQDLPARNTVAAALVARLVPMLEAFDAEGLAPLQDAFAALDVLRGRTVRIVAGSQVHEGQALGIAPDGGLRVRHADRERVWHAGEVSLRL
ncbi:biotin--[acetyl-CoA-carboxylase] ligase [Coralloluteibacterium thermophilus]|uniref:Bifunctional ligase/repressor BirA n=1 Tax=Coralloluteibacterium thermophilum TaxID=2707049 RepID=A0ABV9NEH2_9GAMM